MMALSVFEGSVDAFCRCFLYMKISLPTASEGAKALALGRRVELACTNYIVVCVCICMCVCGCVGVGVGVCCAL